MKTFRKVLIFFYVVFLTSCENNNEVTKSINGVWQSIGSGKIIEIQDGNYNLFDITDISCLPRQEASITDFGESLILHNDTLSLKIGVITYKYIRLINLPKLCQKSISEKQKVDPIYNFEVFAKTIENHYAFFDINKINWDSLYHFQKGKLHTNSSNIDLYNVLEETLELLNDNHGFLEADDSVYKEIDALETIDTSIQEETELIKEYGDFEIANLVANYYLKDDMTKNSWLIKWGKMENNIGYIQLKAMWLFADLELSETLIEENGYVDTYVDAFHQLNESEYINQEKEGVAKVMDIIMQDLKDSNSIIIDVRFNGGGQDAVSFEILSRFNNNKRVVATQKLRFGTQFSPRLSLELKSSSTPFIKPVYVLTSKQTGSAAEAFAIATMPIDHIKRIGSNTSGALSTALEKKLPNGWDFAISNEIYMDNNGLSYENVGIPVDYKLNYSEDRQSFFRSIAIDLEGDKLKVINAMNVINKQY